MCVIPEVKTILLTGGIGSGKSSAAAVLLSSGIPVYDADSKVKSLYGTVSGLVDELERKLGHELRDDEGKFDKSKLSACIFETGVSDNISIVESVVFPYLLDDFDKFKEENLSVATAEGKKGIFYVAMESATALEKTFFQDFGDIRLVIDAPVGLRLQRACLRDGATVEQVMARMEKQPLMNSISRGENVPGIDAVIMNDSTPEVLVRRVKDVLTELEII